MQTPARPPPDMELNTVIGIVLALVVLWVVLLVVFWALRPKGVSVREILDVVPDVLRLLRSVIRRPA